MHNWKLYPAAPATILKRKSICRCQTADSVADSRAEEQSSDPSLRIIGIISARREWRVLSRHSLSPDKGVQVWESNPSKLLGYWERAVISHPPPHREQAEKVWSVRWILKWLSKDKEWVEKGREIIFGYHFNPSLSRLSQWAERVIWAIQVHLATLVCVSNTWSRTSNVNKLEGEQHMVLPLNISTLECISRATPEPTPK